MKNSIKRIFLISMILTLSCGAAIAASPNFSIAPKTNNGKKWRIVYYQGGDYADYRKSLKAMAEGLMGLGWVDRASIPEPKDEACKPLWKWLSTHAKSDYLEFVADGYFCAGWEESSRKKIVARILKRLNKTRDVDLIIAAGTKAGKDIANNRHKTPTMVISTSNPLSAGIIKSIEDSGLDHLHARIDPYRYERQVRIFHEIVGFKRLGVAYENSGYGKVYGAIDKVESIAKERGFDLVRCYTLSESAGMQKAQASIHKCYQELSRKADAVYVTINVISAPDDIPKIADVVNKANLPSFSQSGSKEVKQGILMSISKASFKYVGDFYARTAAMIFNGAKPRQLNQVFEHPPKIAINLNTARAIGYDPPVDVLVAADEIIK